MDVEWYLNQPYGILWHADFSDWRDDRKVHLRAWLKEIPEVYGEGDTPNDALVALREDFSRYLEKATEDGVDIPYPAV